MSLPAPRPIERVRMPDAMAITGKTARCLQAMALKGLIPGATKLGGEWTFDIKMLNAWMKGEPIQHPKPSLPNAVLYEDLEIPELEHRLLGFVYVIGYQRYVKIGWTFAFRDRFTTLQSSTPERLFIYRLIMAKREYERELHERFATSRLQGEWFSLHGPIQRWIDAGYPR